MRKKTITITYDMETPLILALKTQKMSIEELRGFAADRGSTDIVRMYENEIQAIDQLLEKIRKAKWRV